MSTLAFPAVFERDESNRLVVHFPDLPQAHTDGATQEEAFEEAIDCLGSTIAFLLADREPVPRPSPAKPGQQIIPVPLWVSGKLALHWALASAGINQSALARRMGVRETVVRRLLDPRHNVRPERLQQALAALNVHLAMATLEAA